MSTLFVGVVIVSRAVETYELLLPFTEPFSGPMGFVAAGAVAAWPRAAPTAVGAAALVVVTVLSGAPFLPLAALPLAAGAGFGAGAAATTGAAAECAGEATAIGGAVTS